MNEDMRELNSTFKEVARLVEGQGEMVERIEKDAEEAVVTTRKGLEELEEARKYQKGCYVS